MRQNMASHADRGNRYLGASTERLQKATLQMKDCKTASVTPAKHQRAKRDQKAFDFIWVPTMFLPISIMDRITPRIVQALVPGGSSL